jgi:hypothetical protein
VSDYSGYSCNAMRARAPPHRARAALSLAQPTDVTAVLPVSLMTLYQLSREENAQGCRYGPYQQPCASSSRDSWYNVTSDTGSTAVTSVGCANDSATRALRGARARMALQL